QSRGVAGRLRPIPGQAGFRSDRRSHSAQPGAGAGRCPRHRRRGIRGLVGRQRNRLVIMKRISWHNLPARRLLAIGPPFLWLGLFLLVPFLLVLKISFADLQFGVPPYTALTQLKDETLTLALSLRGYALLFSDSLYIATYLNSVKMAALTTLCCALIGYPMAYYIARSRPALRNLLLLGVILPFWTSLLF